MKWLARVGALLTLATAACAAMAQEGEAPKVGDRAPDFKLMGTDGKEYTLKQFEGKSWVAVAWYPRALTGG